MRLPGFDPIKFDSSSTGISLSWFQLFQHLVSVMIACFDRFHIYLGVEPRPF